MSNSQRLMKIMPKKFTLKDLIKNSRTKEQNLVEMISKYPTRGIGFKVRKSHWPLDKFFVLTDVQLETNREGTVKGILYEDGQKISSDSQIIKGATENGDWIYDLGNSNIKLDNGLEYNRKNMEPFWEDETKQNPTSQPQFDLLNFTKGFYDATGLTVSL